MDTDTTIGKILETLIAIEARALVQQEAIALLLAMNLAKEQDPQATLRELSNTLATKLTKAADGSEQGVEGPLLKELGQFIGKVGFLIGR